MRIKTALGAFAAVCALLATGLATVPLIISHQGRLLDGADQPVSGSVSMTFSLYEVPTGGVALTSETQLVVVENGLFSVQLSGLVGSTGLPDVPELWLGRQVGADTELLPRLRVGSVPYAMTATRMQGDITTSPGSISINDVDDADNAVIESSTGQSSFFLRTANASGNADNAVFACSTGQSIFFLKDSNASGEASLRGVVSGLNPGTSNISALYLDIDDDGDGTPVSTVVLSAQVEDADNDAGCDLTMQVDEDDDGVPDASVSSYARKNGAIIACDYNYKSSSRMVATLDSGVMEISHDADNDGKKQSAKTERAEADEASSSMYFDTDDDGTPEYTINDNCYGTGASMNIQSVKGDWDGEMTSSMVSQKLAWDSDVDGTPDVTIDQDCDDTDASVRIRKVDATTGITTSIEQTCDATRGQQRILSFDIPTGTLLGSQELSSSTTGVSHSFHWDSDNDGIMDRTIDDDCNDISASSGIKMQNVATGVNNSIDQDCDEVSARIKVANSDASSGSVVVKGSWDASSSSTGVSHRFVWDSNLDGVVDRTIDDDCNDEGSEMEMTAGAIPNFIRLRVRDNAGLPGGGRDAGIVLGSDLNTLAALVTDDTSSSLILNNSTSYHSWTLATHPQQIKARMTNGTGAIALELDGDGRIGIGDTADASDPIHHISGAHLSAAGDWVNASDKNAKENFSEVDGAEILEKIEDLNISEWNYKAQEDDVRHIGPTAQDFKSVFGVGDDDKSISTIDPSGIALAAIKELYSQLKAKDKQIEELRSEMLKLRKEVSEKK